MLSTKSIRYGEIVILAPKSMIRGTISGLIEVWEEWYVASNAASRSNVSLQLIDGMVDSGAT
jgi:hypothetical protein